MPPQVLRTRFRSRQMFANFLLDLELQFGLSLEYSTFAIRIAHVAMTIYRSNSHFIVVISYAIFKIVRIFVIDVKKSKYLVMTAKRLHLFYGLLHTGVSFRNILTTLLVSLAQSGYERRMSYTFTHMKTNNRMTKMPKLDRKSYIFKSIDMK